MSKVEKYLISENTTIRDAMEALGTAYKTLFVASESGVLLGCLTDGDIRRWILAGKDINDIVSNAMNPTPVWVYSDEDKKAKKLIEDLGILAVPVLNSSKQVVDIVTWHNEAESRKGNFNTPVVIMAGGKGERLMPYTSIVPKPLIPIGEKPISELVIESFRKHGCSDFYFTLNYKKNMIKAYFDELERDYSVQYVEEEKPLGTGGSLCYLKGKIADTFFVSNCDILLDIDYADVMKFHKESKNVVTMITSLKKYVIPYGTIELNDDGRIGALIEKPAHDYLINTGVYVMEPEVLDMIKDNEFIHITTIIENCINEGKNVGTYPVSESAWMDMGQFDEMERMKGIISR